MANTRNQKQRRLERTNEMLTALSGRFPACFRLERKKVRPLAIGIQDDLRKRLASDPELSETPQWLIKQALARYARSPAYLEALAAGKPRLDLDGNSAGEITDEARAYARELREQQKQRASERQRRGKRPTKPGNPNNQRSGQLTVKRSQ